MKNLKFHNFPWKFWKFWIFQRSAALEASERASEPKILGANTRNTEKWNRSLLELVFPIKIRSASSKFELDLTLESQKSEGIITKSSIFQHPMKKLVIFRELAWSQLEENHKLFHRMLENGWFGYDSRGFLRFQSQVQCKLRRSRPNLNGKYEFQLISISLFCISCFGTQYFGRASERATDRLPGM